MKRVAHTSGLRLLVAATCIAAGCTPEPPPRTVGEFIDNPRLLEATMIRCAENRAELKYTPECLNAREAVDRLAAREEAARRAELEAESARKREALRRAQQAAAAARARAEEAERLRREAEYLGQFGEVSEEVIILEDGTTVPVGDAVGSGDGAVPAAGQAPADDANGGEANAPVPDGEAAQGAAAPAGGDLEAIREELRRRQQSEQASSNGQ